MVSPVQVPPPRHRRSLSGPIVLIAIGTVFLLGTMGVLDWHNLGHWFAHYWPVLLIIAGVIKLIEYQQAQRQGTRASGLGAGGIFLIIAHHRCRADRDPGFPRQLGTTQRPDRHQRRRRFSDVRIQVQL